MTDVLTIAATLGPVLKQHLPDLYPVERMKLGEAIAEALAAQPATSQEGEVTQEDRDRTLAFYVACDAGMTVADQELLARYFALHRCRVSLTATSQPENDGEAINGLQPAPGHADGCGAHDDYACDCVATQPATSQEGEAYQRGQEDMRERAAKVCDERGKEEQEGYGLNRAAQNYYRARNAVRDLPIFAATPTPPTLSEDLRDFALVGIERIMREGIHENDGPNRIWIDGVAHEGPVADFTIRTFRKVGETARAALAQVKAS